VTTWHDRLNAQGTPPDPRMSLANERTFLAWIRTSLAMIAGGVGLEAFAGDTIPSETRIPLTIVMLLLGAVLSVGSFMRWHHAELALRRGDPFPTTRLAPLIAGGVAVVSLALVVVVAVRR
jgi:putative membrane protein